MTGRDTATCGACSTVNPASSAFCGSCGQPLKTEHAPPPPQPATPESESSRLASVRSRMPDRRALRSKTGQARKVMRVVRRVSRWGITGLFMGASVFTLWANIDRINIPIIRDLDIPPISEVFGGGDDEAEATTTTTGVVVVPGSVSPGSAEPGSLLGLIAGVAASAGQESAAAAFDGDRTSGWAPCSPCSDPFGVGETLTIEFESPVSITELGIVNGLEGDPAALPLQSVEIRFDGGAAVPLAFDESVQYWRFTDERLAVTASEVRVEIVGVYRVDEETATTAIGEIEIIGLVAGGE